MKIIFRADANSNIGMGHVMRCLSIADACRRHDIEAYFIIADDNPLEIISGRGFDPYVLNSDYRCMDDELEQWPSDKKADYIVVDSYYVTDSYLKSLKRILPYSERKVRIIYIDDVFKFPYPVDCLINYNVFAKELFYDELYRETVVKPKFVLGPLYTPLRKEYRDIPKRTQTRYIKNVLVSTGGADHLHLSLAIADYIEKRISDNDYKFHILIGAMNTDREKISRIAYFSDKIIMHEKVDDMKSLIESCDLVVSAAGSTLYEVCACGVPLITYSVADNQIRGGEAFENLEIGVYIGDVRETVDMEASSHESEQLTKVRDDVCQKLFETIKQIENDYKKRVKIGNVMQNLIDGNGADRIVREIAKMGK